MEVLKLLGLMVLAKAIHWVRTSIEDPFQYKIYTTQFDEIVRPQDLMSQEELDELAKEFHLLCPVDDFEPLREKLDAITPPTVPTSVTILIDNSGSMEGSKITFATGAAGIIGMYLDRLGIQNEILGFTTVAWKGGQAREVWIAAGRPENPGRLCPLRHVIYKSADERLDDVRNNLAIMLKRRSMFDRTPAVLLRENVDGEAVLWACERLRSQSVKRRILLVISDGAPVDDSTFSVNSTPPDKDGKHKVENSYLGRHLKKVVSDVRRTGDIEIDAIGINHDVSCYYGVGDNITRIDNLAPVAVSKLVSLLKE